MQLLFAILFNLINISMLMSKIKYNIEFPIKTSIGILYEMISTPSGLSEWFCDDVNVKPGKFIFIWDGSEEVAEIVRQKNNDYVRYRWEEEEDEKAYFELRIKIDDITKDVAIIVTDFADDEEEVEENKVFWESQLKDLKRVLGS